MDFHRRRTLSIMQIPEIAQDSTCYGSATTARSKCDKSTTTASILKYNPTSLQPRWDKGKRQSVQFEIHEDLDITVGASHNTEHSTLLRPARRTSLAKLDDQIARFQTNESRPGLPAVKETQTVGSNFKKAPKRPGGRLSIVPETTVTKAMDDDVLLEKSSPRIARPARRRGTIYIPNEDTTMPSIYMGIFSPIKKAEGQTITLDRPPTADLTGIAAQMAMKRGRRQSVLDAAPRRAPLQSSCGYVQQATTTEDRYGEGYGKENVPPGLEECEKKMLDLKLVDSVSVQTESNVTALHSRNHYIPRRSRMSELGSLHTTSLLGTQWKSSSSSRYAQQKENSSLGNFRARRRSYQPVIAPPPSRMSTGEASHPATIKLNIPKHLVVPQASTVENFSPLVTGNVHVSAMYEDNWLSHQEIAIEQIINALFEESESSKSLKVDADHLRGQLLLEYQRPENVLIFERLHATLAYGGLGIPLEVLDNGDSLYKDIGKKQDFMNLWMKTYDYTALGAALEVVTGRKVRVGVAYTVESQVHSPSTPKKALRAHIEHFLLKNEDGYPESNVKNQIGWSYSRTMMRSLMLIRALDMTKTCPRISFQGCLFQHTSSHKSSESVVQALFAALNRAVGDPLRALSHINFQVEHVQLPIEEFDYKVRNLAVDLRDGVRLTRLVELLLYRAASPNFITKSIINCGKGAVIMPAGEILEFNYEQARPLSQHLKYPCPGRASRVWNMQIALSAMRHAQSGSQFTAGITAGDLVDGFREKAIRLLWSMVCQCGLHSLVNTADLQWEIRRLRMRTGRPWQACKTAIESARGVADFEPCKKLLQHWTQAVLAHRGITLCNFTTSFADGSAFQAIVDEYEPYLQSEQNQSQSSVSLSGRLMRLGCSHQFSQLFGGGNLHIFDPDFVLASLVFLNSRLVGPTRDARAALVIQQAWRRHWALIEKRRKEVKKQVAVACVELIQCKQRPAPADLDLDKAPKRPTSGLFPHSPGTVQDIWLSV